jgi:C1A family cysteine protease
MSKNFKTKTFVAGISVLAIFLCVFLLQGERADKLTEMQEEVYKMGYNFTVGETSVTHIPLENLCGLTPPNNWWKKANFDGGAPDTEATPPSSFDWRSQGKVTGVRNQGSCGSCWAFGTLASYEAHVAIAGNPLEDLSEEWLLDCNSHGYSCSGGWWVFDDLYNGIPKESCYPYVGSKGTCYTGCTKYYPMDSWYYVGSSSGVPSSSDIKYAIYNYGPVAAAVCVDSYFQNYNSGIFYNTSSGSVNHAIALVGWNDSGGYWILKNSWGTGWGESGYMRIAYGANSVGYSACYGIPESGGGPSEDPYEPNDSYSTAYGPINSGQNYGDAEIESSSDVDWFHFTTQGSGTITVSVTHESGEDLDWYLYQSTDTSNYVARGYTTNNPETGNYNATWVGKYYVKVVGYNGSTSTFTLNVTYPDTGGGSSGYYKFINRYSGYCLDINSGSSYVYHYTDNGGLDKHWEVIDLGNGYYRIDNRYNGNSLDTGSGNYAYNYPWNGNTDKQWQIIDLQNGYYRLDNRANGYSLDVGSGSYVYVYPWNGNTDKQWQMVEVQ